MSRLIDADELRSGLFHLEGETSITDRQLGYQAGWNDALMYAVDDAPTVDAVKVVRCKDCKHYRTRWYGFCELIENENIHREDNDFCSWGERREDD